MWAVHCLQQWAVVALSMPRIAPMRRDLALAPQSADTMPSGVGCARSTSSFILAVWCAESLLLM